MVCQRLGGGCRVVQRCNKRRSRENFQRDEPILIQKLLASVFIKCLDEIVSILLYNEQERIKLRRDDFIQFVGGTGYYRYSWALDLHAFGHY